MALRSTGYNLKHLQVGLNETTPTYMDVNYASTAEFGISQDNDTMRGDGKVAVTTYGAREGEGSIGFGSADLDTIALMTGDVFSTAGTAGTVVDRLEISGATQPPSLILCGWIENVDGNSTADGMRVTVTNGSLAVPSVSFEQESWTEFEADLSFSDNNDDIMLIWEIMETAPVFTSGVIPVVLSL